VDFASNDGDPAGLWFWSITVDRQTRQGTISDGGNVSEDFVIRDKQPSQVFHATVRIYKPGRNGGSGSRTALLNMRACCCPPGQVWDWITRTCRLCPEFTQYCLATNECVPCKILTDAVDREQRHVWNATTCECECPEAGTIIDQGCTGSGVKSYWTANGVEIGDGCGVDETTESEMTCP
jgi:hypothetical protein